MGVMGMVAEVFFLLLVDLAMFVLRQAGVSIMAPSSLITMGTQAMYTWRSVSGPVSDGRWLEYQPSPERSDPWPGRSD